jgi:hypothetical protein
MGAGGNIHKNQVDFTGFHQIADQWLYLGLNASAGRAEIIGVENNFDRPVAE